MAVVSGHDMWWSALRIEYMAITHCGWTIDGASPRQMTCQEAARVLEWHCKYVRTVANT